MSEPPSPRALNYPRIIQAPPRNLPPYITLELSPHSPLSTSSPPLKSGGGAFYGLFVTVSGFGLYLALTTIAYLLEVVT